MRRARKTGEEAEAVPAPGAARVDAIVTHHLDGYRSGVARFNELLAERLGVPVIGLHDVAGSRLTCPLLSFKVSELDSALEADLAELIRSRPWPWELFLHEYRDLELERALVVDAARVHCGSAEIEAAVRALNANVEAAWTPGLIRDQRTFRPSELSVFSFGMAHKIRTEMFGRLKELLDASGRSYSLYVSAANHETASLADAHVVFDEMQAIFPDSLYFLGNLSDVAVSNYLQAATFFAAFFPKGVRANNTSVASAMERGAVVVTNLDRHSPREFVHLDNLIDIERCEHLPSDPMELARIRLRAMETARDRSWDRLAARWGPPA